MHRSVTPSYGSTGLVRDDVLQPPARVGRRVRGFHLFGRRDRRRDERPRVALIGALHRHRDQRAALQIDRMLGFVRQVRLAVFHFRDLRVRITGAGPLAVRGVLLPRAIKPRQDFARRRLDPRGCGEAGQIRLAGFPRVPAHDTPHGGVGLQRRRVDRDRPALQQAGGRQALLDPREHRPVRLHIDHAAGARNRRVIRGRRLQPESQEAPHRQRVRRTPRDAALRIDAFEVPNQQQADVATGRQTRAAQHRRVEGSTGVFHEGVEAVGIQQRIQARVERMPRRDRQIRRGNPQRRLFGVAGAHGHAPQCKERDRSCRSHRQ